MSSQEKAPQSTIQNVVNPNLFPEPSAMRHPELYKYISLDSIKINQSFQNYRKASPYILGILGGCLVTAVLVNKLVNRHIFGRDGKGGKMLNMYTKNNTDDYYYNREFQRMRYLTEEPSGNDPTMKTRNEMLLDLGILSLPSKNNKKLVKKAPHYKYL